MYFSKMCYHVYYHLVKFQLKTPPIHKEMKKTNCIRVNLNQSAQFGGKMNQTIVQGVIQTLAIVQRSNLDFFPYFNLPVSKCKLSTVPSGSAGRIKGTRAWQPARAMWKQLESHGRHVLTALEKESSRCSLVG